MLVSVHVPKCAGTSFKAVLQRIYGRDLLLNYGTFFTREDIRPGMIPPGTRCVHGHFVADALSDLFPGAPLITWVRHPVERLVSNYHFFLNNPDKGDFCSRTLNEKRLSLREFADLEAMRNEASRHFAGKRVDDFQFVGISERFAESLCLFGAAFKLEVLTPVPFENVNPSRKTARYRLAPGDYRYILERNLEDLAFYDEAQARLDDFVEPSDGAGTPEKSTPPALRVI
jgi:hypothetical protein